MSGAVEGVDINETIRRVEYDMRHRAMLGSGGFVGECAEVEAIIAALRASLTTPPARSYADEDVETQWEVWEDDLMVASSTDEADARHYLAVYLQDGPVRLVKSVTVRTPVA